MTHVHPRRHAFTLYEMVMTTFIIAALTTVSLIYVPSYIEKATSDAQARQLSQLNRALEEYRLLGGTTYAHSLEGPNTYTKIGAVVGWLQNGFTSDDGHLHNFMANLGNLSVAKLSATGQGNNFVFTSVTSGVAGGGGSHGIVSFTTVATTNWTVPAGVTSVEILVVAGGGGGGNERGCGGGAGGLIHQMGYTVSPGGSISITVGAGGAGKSSFGTGSGSNGGNSVFDSLTAIGGGGGGDPAGPTSGFSGGSGGGGGTGSFGSGTAGQGNNGGGASNGNDWRCGSGGGGAGTAGSPGACNGNAFSSGTYGGNGGDGLQFSISGTPTYYAGGGGGMTSGCPGWGGGPNGSGGLGGGGNGNGGPFGGNGFDGTVNTGGGGGGGPPFYTGGNGGSGIVIVSY